MFYLRKCELVAATILRIKIQTKTYKKAVSSKKVTGHVTMVEMLTNDLLALHDRIQQAGAHIDKEPEFTNDFDYFTFYDPDGHYIRAVEERGVSFDLKQKIR